MRSGSLSRRTQEGFSYLLVLVALMVVGIVSASAVTLGATLSRRSAEQELLAIGAEYQAALESYRLSNPPGGQSTGPRELAELLRDTRGPVMVRHLRKLYADPVSGSEVWGEIRDRQGRIVGVYSLAEERPIKQNGFTGARERFNRASSYAAWRFGPVEAQDGL